MVDGKKARNESFEPFLVTAQGDGMPLPSVVLVGKGETAVPTFPPRSPLRGDREGYRQKRKDGLCCPFTFLEIYMQFLISNLTHPRLTEINSWIILRIKWDC